MLRFDENPLPGMNPWLESRWGDIHLRLTTYAADQIQTRLPPNLIARGEEYFSVLNPFGEDRRMSPDVALIEDRNLPNSSAGGADAVGVATLDQPALVLDNAAPQTLRTIRISDAEENELVTVVEAATATGPRVAPVDRATLIQTNPSRMISPRAARQTIPKS